MAETGKLGIADSLLANVQLALAAADPTPPAITTQGGSLGGQLGDTILALAGVDGPLTFNLSAGSALALAQTADPAPAFVAHSTPDYVLGGHDSQLGAMEPAFAGAAVATPSLTGQTVAWGRRWERRFSVLAVPPARWSIIWRRRAPWRSRRRPILPRASWPTNPRTGSWAARIPTSAVSNWLLPAWPILGL